MSFFKLDQAVMSYHTIAFKSRLPVKLRDELERIFFFNLRQGAHIEKIQQALEADGLVSIVEVKDSITLSFEKTEAECLYALDSEKEDAALLGVICFKCDTDRCRIIHVAVDPDCAASGEYESELLTFRLIEKIRKMAIEKKVVWLEFPYTGKTIKIKNKIIDILE